MGREKWCGIDPSCDNLPGQLLKLVLAPGAQANGSNQTHHCSYPFCVEALYYTIKHSK